MGAKFSIFSAEIVITGRAGEAPKVRASLETRVGNYLERMQRRARSQSTRELARFGMPIAQYLDEALRPTPQDAIDAAAQRMGLRPREVELLRRIRPNDDAPPAPPPMPHSRREVFEQREASQRGMQQNLRNALALDTIEAFYDDKSDGPIRRLQGISDPEFPPCQACGISQALPMDQSDAAYVRAAFRKARMPAAMAYAFATTRVIVTQKNRHRLCGCDVVAWDRAIAFFKQAGRQAWRRFGLDP